MTLALHTTVVIPAYNEGDRLARALRAVEVQSTERPFEILVLDSASTDGSTSCLEGKTVRRLMIPHGAFNHGETRNVGVRMARGGLVIFLVADAVPIGPRWLQTMVDAMEQHPQAVGGYARQRAWPDADPALKQRIESWTPPGAGPVLKRLAPGTDFWQLPPLEQIRLAAFDNVCSIVRRDHVLAHPFPALAFGEDIVWGQQQILDGRALLYIPSAEVWHSHRRSFLEHVKRARIEHRLLKQRFGLRAVPHIASFAAQSARILAGAFRIGCGGTARQVAELMGQYLAGRRQ